jgi:hypothetical protein
MGFERQFGSQELCECVRQSWFLTYYAVQPWPGAVVAKQILFELVTVLLMGVINAGLHRTQATGTKKAVAHNVVSDMNTEGVLPND